MPDVPTFAELGHPDFTATIWFGLLDPRLDPDAVRERLLEGGDRRASRSGGEGEAGSMGFDVPGLTGRPLPTRSAADRALAQARGGDRVQGG